MKKRTVSQTHKYNINATITVNTSFEIHKSLYSVVHHVKLKITVLNETLPK